MFSDSFLFLKILPFGFLWILWDYSGCSWMLSECSTLFRTFSSSIQIVLETYRYFQIPADSSKFFQIFLDSSRFSQVLTDSFRISQFLSDSLRFFQISSFRFIHILFEPSNFSQFLQISPVSFIFFWTSLSDSFEFFQIHSKTPSGILTILSNFWVLFRSF